MEAVVMIRLLRTYEDVKLLSKTELESDKFCTDQEETYAASFISSVQYHHKNTEKIWQD